MAIVSRLLAAFVLVLVTLAGCQSEEPSATAAPDAVTDPGLVNGPAQRLVEMALVHPRPDVETGVHAQHRNAHPGIPWSTHVVIMGGAYPFRYELLQAPAAHDNWHRSGCQLWRDQLG